MHPWCSWFVWRSCTLYATISLGSVRAQGVIHYASFYHTTLLLSSVDDWIPGYNRMSQSFHLPAHSVTIALFIFLCTEWHLPHKQHAYFQIHKKEVLRIAAGDKKSGWFTVLTVPWHKKLRDKPTLSSINHFHVPEYFSLHEWHCDFKCGQLITAHVVKVQWTTTDLK